MLQERDNMLRVVRFENPECIPMRFHISAACWHHYPQDALKELMASHQLLFPGYEASTEPVTPSYGPWERAGEPYVDPWGCVWETTDNGIVGRVTKHPLERWEDFERYTPPDPKLNFVWRPGEWDDVPEELQTATEEGRLAMGSLRHGHTFLLLADLRGYENLLFDMADDETRLHELIRMVEDYNMAIVRHYVDNGAELMGYAEDLGMQVGPMLSPEHFRKYIKLSLEDLQISSHESILRAMFEA